MQSTTGTTPIPSVPRATIMGGIVIAFIFPLVLSVLISILPLSYWTKVYSSRFIFWAEVLLLWFYARKVEKQKLLIWPQKTGGIEFIVLSVMVLYLLTIGAQMISAIPTFLGYHEDNRVMRLIAATVRGRPGLIVFISFTAGFCEEVIFRGYVLTRLSLLYKDSITPVVLSSLFFAALHYKYNMPREYIFPFLIGIIFSVYYQRYGNIKPLIVVHFIIDVIGLTLASHFLK